MKKLTLTSLLGVTFTLTFTLSLVAQDYDRSVVVEKDFQPIIQNAGKLKQSHALLQTDLPQTPIVFSQPDTSVLNYGQVYALNTPPLTFNRPDTLRGLIDGGFGHINTRLRFRYTWTDNKSNSVSIHTDHKGAWGPKALEKTDLNIRFRHQYSTGAFFLNLFGSNEFYTRYGLYYDGDKGLTTRHLNQIADSAKQTLWGGGLNFGVQSAKKEDIQYKATLQYDLLSMPSLAIEHHAKANLHFNYNNGTEHFGGVNFTFLGSFYSNYNLAEEILNRYYLRLEPFYEYKGQRFFIHVGANIDMNFGKGEILSKTKNVAFAPSPNIYMEAQLAPKWVVLYAQAKGSIGYGHSEDFIKGNRYRDPLRSVLSQHAAAYSPIDARLGFKFRLEKNLLLDIHGGYAIKQNMTTVLAEPNALYLYYTYSHAKQGNVGLSLAYHYQDIVSIKAYGDYFFWQNDSIEGADRHLTTTYDQASWKAGLNVDANIDSHWSLYSHNRLEGSRYALVKAKDNEDYVVMSKGNKYKECKLKPIIDINLGASYKFNDQLSLSLDINNLIHRYNDLYYGIQSRGINFLASVRYRF